MITEEDGKTIARSVGERMLELAASIVAPLYWAQRGDDGTTFARNGTGFPYRTPKHCSG